MCYAIFETNACGPHIQLLLLLLLLLLTVCKDPPAFLEDVLWGSSAADGNNNCAMSIGQKTNCPGVCLK
jgi:hypothetical protein